MLQRLGGIILWTTCYCGFVLKAIVSLKLIIVNSDDWLGNFLPVYTAHCLSKLYSQPGIAYCKCYHGHVHYVPGPWYKLYIVLGNAPPPKGPLSILYLIKYNV